jgi:hypothetical protein
VLDQLKLVVLKRFRNLNGDLRGIEFVNNVNECLFTERAIGLEPAERRWYN